MNEINLLFHVFGCFAWVIIILGAYLSAMIAITIHENNRREGEQIETQD